jgi:hypothetical protein
MSKPVFKMYGTVGDHEQSLDAIVHEEKVWIVAKWSEPLPEGWRRPLRIVCVSPETMRRDGELVGFLLSETIPTSLFDDVVPPETRAAFQIVDHPPLGAEYMPE